MQLPGGDSADVNIAKLRDYCLNSLYPRGRHKARVFSSVLGLTALDADYLRTVLLRAARECEARAGDADEFGARYIVDFVIERNNRAGMIRSAWIIRKGEAFPRLTSCFVL